MPAVRPPRERVAPALDSLLRAADLRDLFDGPEAVWRVHNALVHRVYGVALGFECRLWTGNRVLVGPGVGYDAGGRTLVSSSTVVVPQPPAGTLWELRASLEARSTCPDRVDLRWSRPGDRSARDEAPGLPLTRFVRAAGAPELIDARRWTRRIARPHIVSGRVTGLARFAGNPKDLRHHHELSVPTDAAGFATTPLYLARVREDPSKDPDPSRVRDARHATRGPFVEIRDATPKRFVAGLRWFGWRTPSGQPPPEVEVGLDWVGVVVAERPAVPVHAAPVVDQRGCPVPIRGVIPTTEEVIA